MTSSVIAIRVIPNAKRTCCDGCADGVYRIRIQERAEKGRANKALVIFLAKQLGVRRAEISWVSGEKARQKLLRVVGLTDSEIATKLMIRASINNN